MPTRANPTHYKIGRDIWLRARTNAFANEAATAASSRCSNWMYGIETFFMVLPIAVVSYTYSIISPSAVPLESSAFLALTIVAVASNAIALFLNILNTKLGLSESAFRFKEQLSLYSLIAQKARKLEEAELKDADAMRLVQYLQELFETTKARGIEPNNRYFDEAKQLIKGLNSYPFGLTTEQV